MRDILKKAKSGKYAVGAFNILDYCSMRAVVEAAEELNAPVIIQTSVKTVNFWGYSSVISWYRQLAGESDVPAVLHLDHCKDIDVVKKCIDTGWTSVMIDASSRPFDENIAITKEAAAAARSRDVSVEAELGEIGRVEDGALLTDPEKAAIFCKKTGPDVFAPAIGTAHGLYKGDPKIAFHRLEKIAQQTKLPIALHGGTGLSDEVFKKAISLGCAKINISTMLKHRFIEGFLTHGKEHGDDFNPLNYLQVQFDYLKSSIQEKISLFGGQDKAGI